MDRGGVGATRAIATTDGKAARQTNQQRFCLPQSPYFSLETGHVANPAYEPIEVSTWNSLRIYLVAHVKGSHRDAPIRTLGNHKIARGSVKPRESIAGGVPTRPITIDPVSAGNIETCWFSRSAA
jgi:hypothetical protein